MKIPMAKRQVRHPTRGRAVRMPAFPQAAQWEGREIAKLGRTLSRLGGTLGTLALCAQKLSTDNEVADADLEFIKHMGEEEVKIRLKPAMTWGDEYDKSAQHWITNKAFNTEAARRRSHQRWNRRVTLEKTRLTIAGAQETHRYYRSTLEGKMVAFIDDGQPEKFDEYLQDGFEAGALFEEQGPKGFEYAETSLVSYWKHRAKLYTERKVAIEGIVVAGGGSEESVKEAIAYLGRIKDITAKELKALVKEALIVGKRMRTDATAASEVAQRAAVDNLFGRLTDPKDNPVTYREVVESNSFANLTEKETWTKIAEGMGDPEPETDWKEHNDLVMKLFDYWLGKDVSEAEETYLKTKIASARYAEKYIDDNALANINLLLGQSIDVNHLGGLKRGFEEIENIGKVSWPLGKWFVSGFEARHISQKEAEKIAQARNALISWFVNDRIGRKKETSEEDISVRARQLITSTKESKPEFIQRMGLAQPPFIRNEDGTISTHKMAWGSDSEGYYAFPTIVSRDGRLVELSKKEADDYAHETGELIRFDTKEEAESYAAGSWKGLSGLSEAELLERVRGGR